MKKITLFIFLLLLNLSCSEKKTEISAKTEKKEELNQTLEGIVHRHVESELSIPATENYSLKIYKEHLDGDDKIDAIITVNRLNFALEEARKSGKFEMLKELGFTGHYNYIFYFDGGLNQISPAIHVPSSPQAELKVHFENIISEAYKDILIDYTIRNSSFRNYYDVINHTPRQIFQWKLYDYLNEKNVEVNYLEHSQGSIGLAKDIIIFEGKLENANDVKDIYNFNPKISKKGKLIYRFFYLEKEGKYFTKK
jgi:hypothetical protein